MDVVRDLERRALGLCRLPYMVAKAAYPIVLVREARQKHSFDAIALLNGVLTETGLICGSTIQSSTAWCDAKKRTVFQAGLHAM